MGSKNSNYNYTMVGRVLDVVDSEKDVGVTIHKSLKPSLQCSRAASKANLVLGHYYYYYVIQHHINMILTKRKTCLNVE